MKIKQIASVTPDLFFEFNQHGCSNLFIKGIHKVMTKLLLILTALSLSTVLSASQWVKSSALEAYLGPEIYYVQREKEGGAEQSGTLYGVRAGYDHIHRYKVYWGIDALWAQGELNGKTQEHRSRSIMTDINVEARLGYTFQSKCWHCASITPYTGLGYFWENNDFIHPSPLPIHFSNRFSYIPLGFLSQIFITHDWSLGLNFKMRYLIEGSVKASNDPDHDDSYQNYDERIQYRIELPVTTFHCWRSHSLGISFVPFYEYRSYGYRVNYPFDFLETKFNLYGATLKFLYLF